MHAIGLNERDATLADFSHEVGHSCINCQSIRDGGPAEPCNPIRRLMAQAHGITASETAPRVDKRKLRNAMRKQSRAAKRLLLQLSGKRTRNRRAA